MNAKQRKAKVDKMVKLHSKGYGICDTALAGMEEIFKDLEGYSHCQTGPDGTMEVLIDTGGVVPGDYGVDDALEWLEAQS